MWVHGTEGNGSGLWRTPTAEGEAGKRGLGKATCEELKAKNRTITLTRQVRDAERGLWRTPDAMGGGTCSKEVLEEMAQGNWHRKSTGTQRQLRLQDQVRHPKLFPQMFPTPTGQETEHPHAELTETGRRKTKDGKDSHSLNLADTVKMFPTPAAHEGRLGYQRRDTGKKGTQKSLTTIVVDEEGGRKQTTGQLNPTWVEWLMGYPIGWTDLKDSETP